MALVQIHKVSRGASGLQIGSAAWLISQIFWSVLKMYRTKNMIPSPDMGMLAKSRGQTSPTDTFVYNSYSRRGPISMYSLVIPRLLCRPIWGNSRWWKYHEKRFAVNMPKCLWKYHHIGSLSQSWFRLLPEHNQLQLIAFPSSGWLVLARGFQATDQIPMLRSSCFCFPKSYISWIAMLNITD